VGVGPLACARGSTGELGCGFAGDLAVAGFEGGRERAGVGGVVGGEVAEALEGEGLCCGGDALGLEVGVVGESVEDGGDAGRVEDLEELGDGDVVECCEIGEGEVGAVVVGDEGVEVGGGGIWSEESCGARGGRGGRRRSPLPGPLPRGAGEGGRVGPLRLLGRHLPRPRRGRG